MEENENENKHENVLKLNVNTWVNDANGLYDYFDKNGIITVQTYIDCTTYLSRNKKNDLLTNENHKDAVSDDKELIFSISKNLDGSFTLKNLIPKNTEILDDKIKEKIDNLNNKIWYIVKDYESSENSKNQQDYFLCKNDIIKLGKIKYLIKLIPEPKNENKENTCDAPQPINIINNKKYNLDNSKEAEIFDMIHEFPKDKYIDVNKKIEQNDLLKWEECDLCKKYKNDDERDEGDERNNYLIQFCKCDKKYHHSCLKNYLNEMKLNQEGSETNLIYPIFGCEHCNTIYPVDFKLENIKENFSFYKIPEKGNYMILESLDYYQDDKLSKIIHIVKLNKKIITIGREKDNDIREKDISISRHHAILRYDDFSQKISIENCSKKFGTLVLIRREIEVLEKPISLQVGRSYIETCVIDKNKYLEIKEENDKQKRLMSQKSQSSSENNLSTSNHSLLYDEK